MSVRQSLLAAALMLAPVSARAATPAYPALYAFGDSMSDSGNGYIMTSGTMPISPPYAVGRWSNGPTWVQDLANALGLPLLTPSLGGGTNFAVAGACAGVTLAHPFDTKDLPGQLVGFAYAVPNPVAGALYTLDIGSNDLRAIFQDLALTPAQGSTAVRQAVTDAGRVIQQLYADGMRTLLLLTVPDQSKQPLEATADAITLAEIHAIDVSYNTQLVTAAKALAAQDGFRLIVLDMFALSDGLAANPAAAGFSNGTDACYTGDSTVFDGTLCSSTLIGQDSYVYWDDIHPTARTHMIIASAAWQALSAAGGTVHH